MSLLSANAFKKRGVSKDMTLREWAMEAAWTSAHLLRWLAVPVTTNPNKLRLNKTLKEK